MKSILSKLREFACYSRSGNLTDQPLFAEQLEPRVLFSAAPVQAPPVEDASTATTAPADPAVDAQPAQPDESSQVEVELTDIGDLSSSLNQAVVESLAVEARQRWIDSGISAQQLSALDSVQYSIADVGGEYLGVAEGNTITIDDDAGGTGVENWFIDSTPSEDSEFDNPSLTGSAAFGRYDLLSTLIHEQGHVLGLSDLYGEWNNVMGSLLDTGTRRLPVAGQADGAVAGSLSGVHYLQAHIVRASIDSNGVEGNNHSSLPALSGDGRLVVFTSQADNLVTGDTNGVADVFVKDLVTGEIVRASTDSNGVQGNATSTRASISEDGRYVVFESVSTNLVAGDTNGKTDVFLKDLQTGETTRVSIDKNGAEGDEDSDKAKISANGRYVVFNSRATTLLAADGDTQSDIYLKDLRTGRLSLISTAANGVKANGASYDPSISADGRYIAFDSFGDNLGPVDGNGDVDVYVKDRRTGAVMLASSDDEGIASDTYAESSMISANGRYVVFGSDASNLVDLPDNGEFDLYVKDLRTGGIVRANLDHNGGEAAGGFGFGRPSISADGRFVVFSSDSTELQNSSDPHGLYDVFLKDMETGYIRYVNSSATGQRATGSGALAHSRDAVISADGKFVAFSTGASDLVANDTNGDTDIFVKAVASETQESGLSISIDPYFGNLEIDDQTSGTDNRISIGIVNGMLEIRDKRATIVSAIVGGEQPDDHTLRLDLSLFTGDLLVDLGFGNDRVDVGDLSGLSGGIEIEGGAGFDQIFQKGSVMLTGTNSLSYKADRIVLTKGASVQSEDGHLDFEDDNGSEDRRFTGFTARHASIITEGGAIGIDTNGGNRGSGNVGIDIAHTEIRSGTDGRINFYGSGGDGRNGNIGVIVRRGSEISATDPAGGLYIEGEGGGTGNGNGGVRIDSGVMITSGWFASLDGDGSNDGRSGNYGIRIGKATIATTGSGNVHLSATGDGFGPGNHGGILTGTTLQTSGTGDVDVLARGSSDGFSGQGLILRGASFIAEGTAGDVEISAYGRGTRSGVIGLNAFRSILESANGEIRITANSQAGANQPEPAKNNNLGARIAASTLTAATNVEISTRSGTGINGNTALSMSSAQITAGGNLLLEGNVYTFGTELLSEGSNNRGIDLNRVDLHADSVQIDGRSAGGRNNNESVRIRGGSLATTGGHVMIDAKPLDDATETGKANRGLHLVRTTINSAGNIEVVALGGAGSNGNSSARIVGSTLNANGGSVDIEADGDTTSGRGNSGAEIFASNITALNNVDIDASSGSGTHRNVAVDIRKGSITAQTGDLNIDGAGHTDATGSFNFGISIVGTTISAAASDLLIMGTGGGGLNNNRGLSIMKSTLVANGGTGVVGVYGTSRSTTTGVRNIGNYLFNGVLLDGDAEIGGTGGGGTGLNHGIFAKRNVAADSVIFLGGTAGDGDSSENYSGDADFIPMT